MCKIDFKSGFKHFESFMQMCKDIESTMHFFLHCTNVLIPRQTLS